MFQRLGGQFGAAFVQLVHEGAHLGPLLVEHDLEIAVGDGDGCRRVLLLVRAEQLVGQRRLLARLRFGLVCVPINQVNIDARLKMASVV